MATLFTGRISPSVKSEISITPSYAPVATQNASVLLRFANVSAIGSGSAAIGSTGLSWSWSRVDGSSPTIITIDTSAFLTNSVLLLDNVLASIQGTGTVTTSFTNPGVITVTVTNPTGTPDLLNVRFFTSSIS